MEVHCVALSVVEEDALEEGGDGADGVVARANESNVNHILLKIETFSIKVIKFITRKILTNPVFIDVVGIRSTEFLSEPLHLGLCDAETIREAGLAAYKSPDVIVLGA